MRDTWFAPSAVLPAAARVKSVKHSSAPITIPLGSFSDTPLAAASNPRLPGLPYRVLLGTGPVRHQPLPTSAPTGPHSFTGGPLTLGKGSAGT